MLSFHNDPSIKEKYLERLKLHYIADEIIKGLYWQEGKGCAVGCTIHSRDHNKYEIELGIPEWLAWLEDKIFESLPNDKAKEFPLQFLEVIPVGVDLEQIKKPFLIFILETVLDSFDHDNFPKIKVLINNLISLLNDPTSTKKQYKDAAVAAYAANVAHGAHGAYAAYAAYAAYTTGVVAYDDAAYAAYAANVTNVAYTTVVAAYAADVADAYAAAAHADHAADATNVTNVVTYVAYTTVVAAADAAADAAYADHSDFYEGIYYRPQGEIYTKFSLKLLKLLKGCK